MRKVIAFALLATLVAGCKPHPKADAQTDAAPAEGPAAPASSAAASTAVQDLGPATNVGNGPKGPPSSQHPQGGPRVR